MATSDELHKLTDKAKEAEEKATTARHQAKADLEKAVSKSRTSMDAHTARMRESATESRTKASSWWGEQQAAWTASTAKMHQNMDERKMKNEAKVTEREADQADADASFAIEFAYGAIEAAEYAVLSAVLAREKADEAVAATAGQAR